MSSSSIAFWAADSSSTGIAHHTFGRVRGEVEPEAGDADHGGESGAGTQVEPGPPRRQPEDPGCPVAVPVQQVHREQRGYHREPDLGELEGEVEPRPPWGR
jgi:hypothetical protein